MAPKKSTTETGSKNPETSRPPVVTVMGHIDHGKSTLLDYIRKTNVTEKEVGGITQRISAYQVRHKDEGGAERVITFLDTPGHEAFQKMRFHSAAAADIAILVVSSEDGVKEQTLEAYRAAKEKNIPVIVAITKIDKPNANVERAKNMLAENEIYIEGYGGDLPYIPLSSKTGEGVKELLDMVLLVAEMADLKGSPEKLAEGVIIESLMDSKKGIVGTLLIKDGVLEQGMFISSGTSLAPVRFIENFLGARIEKAGISDPVRVTGWSTPPPVGLEFHAYRTKKEAEQAIELFTENKNSASKNNINTREPENECLIPILLKAETLGSLDAIVHEIDKIKVDGCTIRIIGTGVGTITETDIKAASGSTDTLILGFGVKLDSGAKELGERVGITVSVFDIIYKLTEWLAEEVEKRRPRIEVEERKGTIKILKMFGSTKGAYIVGGRVTEGVITLNDKVKIMRREFEIGRGEITELQEQKMKTREVLEGKECGMKVASKYEIAPGDILEAFAIVKK